MKCEECELLLAQDESSSEVGAHLKECTNCRTLAVELQANTQAMRAMGEDVMPPVAVPARHLPSQWWKLSSAAAALIITLGAAWWASRPEKPPQIVSIDVKVTGVVPKTEAPVVKAPIPDRLTPTTVPIVPVINREPLRVKMLTSDPDVVIYWLVD